MPYALVTIRAPSVHRFFIHFLFISSKIILYRVKIEKFEPNQVPKNLFSEQGAEQILFVQGPAHIKNFCFVQPVEKDRGHLHTPKTDASRSFFYCALCLSRGLEDVLVEKLGLF